MLIPHASAPEDFASDARSQRTRRLAKGLTRGLADAPIRAASVRSTRNFSDINAERYLDKGVLSAGRVSAQTAGRRVGG